MDDLISRKDAIKSALIARSRCHSNDIIEYSNLIFESLRGLPGVEPKTDMWIPINKNCPDNGKLPSINVEVLISMRGYICKAFRCGSGEYWYTSNFSGLIQLCDVDAWMSKPEPYKEVAK